MNETWIICTLADSEKIKSINYNFYSTHPNGKVFRCQRYNDKYIISYKNSEYIITGIIFKEVNGLFFDRDNEVIINGSDKKGVISEIYWHFKNTEPYYILKIDNKEKNKRYTNKDLFLKNNCG